MKRSLPVLLSSGSTRERSGTENLQEQADGPEQPHLPVAVHMEASSEGEVSVDEARGKDAEVTEAGERALPRPGFDREEEPVLGAPVDGGRGGVESLLPDLIGESVESGTIARAQRGWIRDGEPRIKPNCQAGPDGEHMVSGWILGGRRRVLGPGAEGEDEVEDVAEALEAVADAVQAEEEPFIGGGEEPCGNAVEIGGLGALPDLVDMEVEGERILDVVVEFDGGAAAKPGPLIVVAPAGGEEADFAKQGFRFRDIGAANEQVKVRIRTEVGVSIEAFAKPGAFERDDGNVATVKFRQRGFERRGPEKCGDLGSAANLVKTLNEQRIAGAGGAEAGCSPGQDVFLFSESERGEPLR